MMAGEGGQTTLIAILAEPIVCPPFNLAGFLEPYD